MRIEIMKCDGCGQEMRFPNAEHQRQCRTWITTTRSASDNISRITAGEMLFCSEACLVKFLTRNKSEAE
jgi:hypothetical protein